MTDRNDIFPTSRGWRPLSYTYRCGWVDWGHALKDGPKKLLTQLKNEKPSSPVATNAKAELRLEGKPAFLVVYGLKMGIDPIGVPKVVFSTRRHWIVRKGLSKRERERVGLAIHMAASRKFEKIQGQFPFSLASGSSSFSGEDLVSNVIGFYAAARNLPQAEMRKRCGEVSVQESLRIWDQELGDGGLSALKREKAKPVFFDVKPEEVPAGMDDRAFPALFSGMKPVPPGSLWTKLEDYRFIPTSLLIRRNVIDVSANGQLKRRR